MRVVSFVMCEHPNPNIIIKNEKAIRVCCWLTVNILSKIKNSPHSILTCRLES